MSMTQKDLLQAVLEELAVIKKDLPNGQFKQLMNTVADMKEDVSELKKTLLNPENGVIVKTNKSLEIASSLEEDMRYYDEKMIEIEELVKWKNGVSKALWILFAAVVGLTVQMIAMLNAG